MAELPALCQRPRRNFAADAFGVGGLAARRVERAQRCFLVVVC